MNAAVEIRDPATEDGRADFDFLHGDWRVQHRLLKRRGAGCEEWDVFEGTVDCRALMDGLCNIEEHDLGARGTKAVGFRCFDIARRTWAIYWVSSTDGLLGEPVFGGFEAGVGRFYGVDLDAGRPVKVAFVWKDITPTSAHWSQAFSYDDGKTWEMNWQMAFTRNAEAE
jgi:hypothetical protein